MAHYNSTDGTVGFVVPVEDKPDHFVVGVNRKVLLVKWDGSDNGAVVVRTLAEVDAENPQNRLNDGKADPKGRLFAGELWL